jgi:hypothetical protein
LDGLVASNFYCVVKENRELIEKLSRLQGYQDYMRAFLTEKNFWRGFERKNSRRKSVSQTVSESG